MNEIRENTKFKAPPVLISTLETDKTAKTAVFEITNDLPNRNGYINRTDGISLENYIGKENKPVLFSHEDTAVIGKSLWIRRRTREGVKGMIAKVEYADTDLAQETFYLVNEGFLVGASVGLFPLDWSYGESAAKAYEEDFGAKPPKQWAQYAGAGDADWRAYMRKSELLEWSNVAIPANPETLKQKSHLLSDAMKSAIAPYVIEQIEARIEAIEASLKAIKDGPSAQAGAKEIPQGTSEARPGVADYAALVASLRLQLQTKT